MRPPPRKSSSVVLVAAGWLVSVILCAPLSLLAGIGLADLLAPETGRASGDPTWFLLTLLGFAVLAVLATVGWSWVWSRTSYRPCHEGRPRTVRSHSRASRAQRGISTDRVRVANRGRSRSPPPRRDRRRRPLRGRPPDRRPTIRRPAARQTGTAAAGSVETMRISRSGQDEPVVGVPHADGAPGLLDHHGVEPAPDDQLRPARGGPESHQVPGGHPISTGSTAQPTYNPNSGMSRCT
jgi:hypothetical protein